MIYLAYDGSLNGDWVARYALRFALHNGGVLTVLHVPDATRTEDEISAAFARLVYDGSVLGVEVRPRLLEPDKTILRALLREIPSGPESLVVCGTRARSRKSAYLAGTITEKLLHGHRFATLALRVVQPGLLGAPRNLLLPVIGHPHGVELLLPFFRLLAPDLHRVELLRGINVSPFRIRNLSEEQLAVLHAEGARALRAIGRLLAPDDKPPFRLDSHTLVCDDWEHEIAVYANRLKARLILVGAQPRTLPHRLIFSNPLERLLRNAPCDVALYRAP